MLFKLSLTVLELEDYEGFRVDRLMYDKMKHYRPSWKTWLLTPSSCLRYESVRLYCDNEVGYGLTICGGWNGKTGESSVFITGVQKKGPAMKAGLLPGYEIISFHNHASCVLSVEQIERMLKIS